MTIARTILRIGVSVFSILLAMLTGAILILLIGKDPILAYGFLFRGAFGSLPSIGETIVKVTPLIFTGLAAVFSYQCGMLNLGIEGQFIAGAIAANWLSTIVLPFTGAANMILSLIPVCICRQDTANNNNRGQCVNGRIWTIDTGPQLFLFWSWFPLSYPCRPWMPKPYKNPRSQLTLPRFYLKFFHDSALTLAGSGGFPVSFQGGV